MCAWTLPTTGNKLNKPEAEHHESVTKLYRSGFFPFFSSTGGVFRAFCCVVWQWNTEHQTGNAPKPPFYSSSTKQFSCNGFSTGPVAETLHEQDTVIESRESRIDIVLGTRKGRHPRNNWCNVRASSCWESPILDYKQWRNSWEECKL